MKIVFMGTPDFSLECLSALVGGGCEVAAVVTQPDRPKGRGGELQAPPVKLLAIEKSIPVMQPEDVNREAGAIAGLAPDCIVTVAYGQLLSKEILEIPSLGCVNVHASLLPALRGASPIQWAIINGDDVTGITTIMMDAGMDSGDILLQREVPIGPEDDAGALSGTLARVGAEVLMETLRGLEEGSIIPRPQDHSRATFAPAISKDRGRIDWNSPARSIVNLVRGCAPWPTAYTFHKKKTIKLWKARVVDEKQPPEASPGTIVAAGDDGVVVAAGEGAIRVMELQREGKKRMGAGAFLRGYPLESGDKFAGGPEG
ncbi:MAG: methionyl-tRNA formyltransferase [bacterium]